LLAFAIDASWADFSDRTTERELLVSLEAELRRNRAELTDRVAFAEALEESALSLLQLPQNGAGVSADSVERLLADLTWWGGASWESATIDALVSSGDLALIQHRPLRRQIAAWAREVEDVAMVEEQEGASTRDQWLPFLAEQSDLVAIGRAQIRSPGTGEPYDPALILPAGGAVDHRPLLSDPHFRNLTLIRYWVHADLLLAYSDFAEVLDSTIDMIVAQLAG